MKTLYVPFSGDKPASVVVNGHRLVILAQEDADLEENLGLLGADHVESVGGGNSMEEQAMLMGKLAKLADGGVVIAPKDADLGDLIKNLEAQLPWLQ
jgi:hypothetical protein